ncbi:hypothetical protein VTJ04DRAFT_8973 [Mycothermus thermophilus]|uniref:uncharacterized protein n=1 Tax=Humicola insolens TaxID=85995 RepID=UPI003743B98F
MLMLVPMLSVLMLKLALVVGGVKEQAKTTKATTTNCPPLFLHEQPLNRDIDNQQAKPKATSIKPKE